MIVVPCGFVHRHRVDEVIKRRIAERTVSRVIVSCRARAKSLSSGSALAAKSALWVFGNIHVVSEARRKRTKHDEVFVLEDYSFTLFQFALDDFAVGATPGCLVLQSRAAQFFQRGFGRSGQGD